ncbi:MAG: hypothetical protein ABIJ37_10865 [Pseudomonadota bacterium]
MLEKLKKIQLLNKQSLVALTFFILLIATTTGCQLEESGKKIQVNHKRNTLPSDNPYIERWQLAYNLINALRLNEKLEVRVIVGQASFKPPLKSVEQIERIERILDLDKNIPDNISKDASDFLEKVKDEIEMIVELGIMKLYPGNRFKPFGCVTKENLKDIVRRILMYSQKETVAEDELDKLMKNSFPFLFEPYKKRRVGNVILQEEIVDYYTFKDAIEILSSILEKENSILKLKKEGL